MKIYPDKVSKKDKENTLQWFQNIIRKFAIFIAFISVYFFFIKLLFL